MKAASYTLLFVIACLQVGLAQTEQQILPSELKKQTIITQPPTLYKGFFRVGMAANYSFVDKIFDGEGSRESISNFFGSIWAATAVVQYGVSDRLQVDMALPYQHSTIYLSFLARFPFDNSEQQASFKRNGSGLGDLYLTANYQLLTETEMRPAIVARADVFLPTGEKNPTNIVTEDEYDLPTGDGHLAAELTLSARKVMYPYLFNGYVGYKYNFESSKIFDPGGPEVSFQDGGLLTVSALVGFHVNEWMAIINDLQYSSFGKNVVDNQPIDNGEKWTVSYLPRISFQMQQLRINQALTFPVIGKSSGADPGYIIVVQYVF